MKAHSTSSFKYIDTHSIRVWQHSMNLKVGGTVKAVIKSTEVMLLKDQRAR